MKNRTLLSVAPLERRNYTDSSETPKLPRTEPLKTRNVAPSLIERISFMLLGVCATFLYITGMWVMFS